MSIFSSPPTITPCFLVFYRLILATSIFALTAGFAGADEAATQNKITSITAQQIEKTVEIKIVGSTEPAYTVYELFSPARIVVDIADSIPVTPLTLESLASFPISLSTKSIADATPPLTRFEFTLPESLPFQTTRQENNILISINSNEVSKPQVSLETNVLDGVATAITDINVSSSATETTVTFLANGKISYFNYDVLDKDDKNPPRLYVDILNVSADELLREQNIGTILSRIRVAKRDNGIRIVLDSSEDFLFPFQIHETENSLQITITEQQQQMDQISSLINQKQSIDEQLPKINPISDPNTLLEQPDIAAVSDSMTDETAGEKMKDNFNFSGYNKKRITVDFYKIDLHNVFRLLREISEQNIVVDESVNGSLTLALNDVPWDFALDIIINIKDLQKEERFNTIVILPKSKEFSWPNRAEDNLTFEAVEEIAIEEAIVIQQRQNLPKTVIEAKKLITKGKQLENDGDYENAIHTYKDAFLNWPQNAELANKISSLYLVQLRQNANAVHYAKKALEINNQDMKAALNAAIGSANMQKSTEAQEFFDQSVSGDTPSREALLSYAVFSEENKLYDAALTLLKKHDQIHGENLDSMLAQARILDKQGNYEASSEKYQNILLSGFRIPPDLNKYINGRIALSQQ